MIDSVIVNPFIYGLISVSVVTFLFLDKYKYETSLFLLLAYCIMILITFLWFFVFNRQPRLPIMRITLEEKRMTIEELSKCTHLEVGSISDFRVAGFIFKRIVVAYNGNSHISIGYHQLNSGQRVQLFNYLSSIGAIPKKEA